MGAISDAFEIGVRARPSLAPLILPKAGFWLINALSFREAAAYR